ncbi:hypothetical protein TSOC_006195 [Tetrabaena socialis]|uniref:Uncharacterized protein n=1 Tax=Tetrabaena socialis TaxID=47790 RepID=A0A2J8A4A5_9CHLO|nr:hypothetical protein TSOC_006195 [Tetrabaena socialis]|eukprot:PNH07344.1 hypothetical protein TSOC_006195 [Tetrabaena socialis]
MIRQLKKALSRSRSTSEKVEVIEGEAAAAEAGAPVAVRPKAKPPTKPPLCADATATASAHLSDATAHLSDLSVVPPPPSRKQQPPAPTAQTQPPGKSAWSTGAENATDRLRRTASRPAGVELAREGGDAVSHFSDRWQDPDPVQQQQQQHAGGRARASAAQPASTLLSGDDSIIEHSAGRGGMGRSGSLRATPLAVEQRGQGLL